MPRRLFLGLVMLSALVASATAAAEPVTVAVVDTGVDTTQPFLAGRLAAGYDALAEQQTGWHGTAIASVAAGTLCQDCVVMPVKALDAAGDGSDADIARGIRWAVDHGARVVNLSLEGPSEAPVLRTAIAYAFRKGAVVVAAAGNDAASAPTYPAADRFAIGVAAVDVNGRLYPWSNRGRWVAVAAAGVNSATVPGGATFGFEGTSSAAAVVSGIAGRCLAAAPSLTPTLVRRALVAAATPIAGAAFGRVDADRTVALCLRLATEVPS